MPRCKLHNKSVKPKESLSSPVAIPISIFTDFEKSTIKVGYATCFNDTTLSLSARPGSPQPSSAGPFTLTLGLWLFLSKFQPSYEWTLLPVKPIGTEVSMARDVISLPSSTVASYSISAVQSIRRRIQTVRSESSARWSMASTMQSMRMTSVQWPREVRRPSSANLSTDWAWTTSQVLRTSRRGIFSLDTTMPLVL